MTAGRLACWADAMAFFGSSIIAIAVTNIRPEGKKFWQLGDPANQYGYLLRVVGTLDRTRRVNLFGRRGCFSAIKPLRCRRNLFGSVSLRSGRNGDGDRCETRSNID